MRRSSVLNMVVQECKKQGVTGLLGEMVVRPLEDAVRAKRRSIFIVGANEADIRFATDKAQQILAPGRIYEAKCSLHGTIEEPNFSEEFIPLSDTSLENNWRSRLIRLNQIAFENADQIKKLVLTATWRLIVTRRGNEFFVRHDIYPVIWSPGFSVAGGESLESPIENEIEYFSNRQSRLFDDHNDILKVFAGEAEGEFQALNLANHPYLRISQIQIAKDHHKEDVLEALRTHFQIG